MPLDRLDVKDLLKSVTKLPTLPTVAFEIIKIANDPKTAAEDLSKILIMDQSLSAKVLRMVNSSYYSVRNKISSIKQAVVILGFESVRSLGLSTAIMDKFGLEETAEGFSRKEFWKHSLGVAMTSRLIARKIRCDRDTEEFYYMAGLMHDIGKVIMDQYFPENFAQVIVRIKERGVSFLQVELEMNGITHDEIGAFLAGQWNLPENIVNAIRYHHRPLEATADQKIVYAVHFANILTKTKGMGSGGDSDITNLNEEAIQRLGINDNEVGVMVETEMDKEFEGAKEFLELLS